jgi:hypothetical protein
VAEGEQTQRKLLWTIGIVLIVLIAFALRFRDLTGDGLWVDEGLSLHLAQTPLDTFLSALSAREQTPPLFHLLLKGWIAVWGDSDLAIRALPALIGVAGVALLGVLLRPLGWWTSLAGAAFLAVNPYHITYSQEARGYGLLVLMGVASCWAMARCIARPTVRDQTIFVVASALLLYTHLYGVFVLLAQNLVYLTHRLWRQCAWRAWLMMQAAVLLLFAPFLPTVVRWVAGVSRGFWIEPGQFTLAAAYRDYAGAWWLLGALLAAAIVAVAVRENRRDWRMWLLVWLAILPVIVPVTVSALTRPIFVDRYGIVAAAAMCGLAGIGIARMGRLAGTIAFLVIFNGSLMQCLSDPPPAWRVEWREAVQKVNQNGEEGDVILVHQAFQTSPVILHYLTHPGVGVAELPPDDPRPAIDRWRADGRDVWVIAPTAQTPALLDKTGPATDSSSFRGLDVHHYAAPWHRPTP